MSEQTPRSNFYAPIHKALRRAHSLLLVELGGADWSDASEAQRLGDAVARQIDRSAQHLEHEDIFLRPLIVAVATAEGLQIDDDHADHVEKFVILRGLLDRISIADPCRRAEAGHELYLAFTDFAADDFAHMAFEERVIMPLLHKHYDDATLHEVHNRLVASIPPAEFLESIGMMLLAFSPMERAGMISGMRQAAPSEVVEAVLAAGKSVLDANAWNRLDRDLAALAA